MVRFHLVVMGAALSAVIAAVVSVRIPRRPRVEATPIVASAAADPSPQSPGRASGRVSTGAPSMLHLDPRHTNRSPFEGPTAPTVVWTFDAGGPIEAAPAVLEDGTILVASLGGKLFGLTETGKVRFSVDLGDRIYASPLVSGDAIFIGSDAHKFMGLTRDGVIRFRLDAPGDVDTGAAPTPWGGIVFASGRVLHATKPDGTLIWRVQARRKCYSSPAVADDGTVYVGSQDHYLYAVSAEGKVRWRVDLGADVDSSPAVQDDGTIIVGSDKGEVVALAPENGEIRWAAAVGGFVRGAMSVGRDGTVFTGTYGPTPRLVALEPANGAVRFRFPVSGTGASEFGIHGGPVEDAAGRLYFGAQDDHAYCLAADGTLLWKLRTGGDVDAPLVITPKGLLLVGSDDGKLYAVGRI
ncbi:MAG TPA: PQQ-binding-like beta-propeller repeat protein [Polyangiaceae bacterium]|nr:PQQ-binding-like beta-propeller repeat protein [Polyangiaceae bacterium]